MQVAVVYNTPRPQDLTDQGIVEQSESIAGFLREAGHSTVVFALDDVADLAGFLRRQQPEVIFNCCESFQGDGAHEMNVAGIFELFGIPYTGSSALSLGISLNKGIAKALFQANDVPTAPYIVVDDPKHLPLARRLKSPLIVKPVAQDASIGIDDGAVVSDDDSLRRRVQYVLEKFKQPAIVEQFIDGREVHVALLAKSGDEFETLPIIEFPFEGLPACSPRILGYDAKWRSETQEYHSLVARCPADLDPELSGRVRRVALSAAQAVGMRDYGRIDLRIRAGDNAVFVLEANPNPQLTIDSDLLLAAQAGGRSYAQLVCAILDRAAERARKAIV